MDHGVIITETPHGFVCANGGVDASNVGPESGSLVTLLPEDPDASAGRIRDRDPRPLRRRRAGHRVGPFGRPWRWGIVDVAIGVSGLHPLDDLRGTPDADGRVMRSTVRAVADEIASAAELALGKTAGRPAALVRGARFVAWRGLDPRLRDAGGDRPLPLTRRRRRASGIATPHEARPPDLVRSRGPAGPRPSRRPSAASCATADDVGFDSIWVMDHFFQIRGVGRPHEPMLEGWTTLGLHRGAHASARASG